MSTSSSRGRPRRETAAGGAAAIQALIDLAVLETNVAFQRSRVAIRLNLVFSSVVAYVETGDMKVDLNRLRNPEDGHMDIVHTWRDASAADAVSLFVAEDSKCGRSFNMGAPPTVGFASNAFNLVSQGCATGIYAFGHEFGHNFGLDHDRPNTQNVPSRPYAYGYWMEDDTHRTIMSLERGENFGVRLQYFANPTLALFGDVMGPALARSRDVGLRTRPEREPAHHRRVAPMTSRLNGKEGTGNDEAPNDTR